MCIRDRSTAGPPASATSCISTKTSCGSAAPSLSLIHISEPTRLGMISYAVFCLKKKRRPPRSTQSRSSAASDVYKRQVDGGPARKRHELHLDEDVVWQRGPEPVSYTHLRAHETRHDLVCRLLLEKKTATTEIYTE